MPDVVSVARPARAPVAPEPRWLVLFHQIPPSPAYLRVKIGRRLARVGALGLKNTVYVLPRSEATHEDLRWIVAEIVDGGGDATLCEARFVEGLTDGEIERRFQDARDEDYGAIAGEARELGRRKLGRADDDARGKLESDVSRLERRLEELAAIDFFHAPGREAAVGLVASLRERLQGTAEPASVPGETEPRARYRGKVWVTRTGVHVDRIASAWLVRRFVDPEARFKFVPPKGYVPEPGEVRFDMFDAEFTHEGDQCTFEVLVKRLSLVEPGVRPIAEVVHDIDLKDGKYARPETAGIASTIIGICTEHRSDEARLEAGVRLFDHLCAFFSRRRS